MELSATNARSTAAVDLLDAAGAELLAGGTGTDGAPACADAVAESFGADSLVVHVQLRPRRPATRRCLAALTELAAQHPAVGFALTGLSKDDRVVRVTVGVDLGPRAQVAKFSDEAQAAYAFVDGLFTQLYDHMPVYVAEPSEAERTAAAGVLDAAAVPSRRASQPRIPTPRRPMPGSVHGSEHGSEHGSVPALVPAPRRSPESALV
jgi:hypothetical protein